MPGGEPSTVPGHEIPEGVEQRPRAEAAALNHQHRRLAAVSPQRVERGRHRRAPALVPPALAPIAEKPGDEREREQRQPQHLADVVERGRGADVAAQDGEVLVAADVGDLALLDAGGRGGGGVAGPERVAGERGELLEPGAGVGGAALDDQRDGLVWRAAGR